MAAHRKLDQRRDDLCAGGFRLPRPYRSYRYTSGIFRAERDLVIRPYAVRKRQSSQSTEEVPSRPVGGGNRRSPGGNRGLLHNHR